jgi:hypothetical protein
MPCASKGQFGYHHFLSCSTPLMLNLNESFPQQGAGKCPFFAYKMDKKQPLGGTIHIKMVGQSAIVI